MAIGVAELTHAVKEVENQSFRTFETYLIATIIYLVCSLLLMADRRVVEPARQGRSERAERMLINIYHILRDNWLLLLVGQYPNGPLGGIAATLLLSVLGIALAFPLSVLIGAGADCRRGGAALAGDGAGLHHARRAAADDHLLGLLPGSAADRARSCRASSTMVCHARDLRGRVPERNRARRHRGAARRADGCSARARPQPSRRDAIRHPAAGALQHDAEHPQPVRLHDQGNDAGLRDQRSRTDVRGEPDQQPACLPSRSKSFSFWRSSISSSAGPSRSSRTGWSAASRRKRAGSGRAGSAVADGDPWWRSHDASSR